LEHEWISAARHLPVDDVLFRLAAVDHADVHHSGSPESAGVARSPSDELSKLASLHQRGVINDEEFERVKMRVM
jgi:Short C-terminal domain